MSLSDRYAAQLETARKLFRTTTSVFEAPDAAFAPDPELYTVAGHIAHSADAMEWFVEGAFGKGWDFDLAASIAKAKGVTDLGEARAWLDRAFDRSITVAREAGDELLEALIPDDSVMGPGAPRIAVINAIIDHTAHHRGALAVYARLLGKAPPMLYS